MNQRELSEKLDELATTLESICGSDNADYRVVYEVAQKLRKLGNENYAPGNSTTWDAIKSAIKSKSVIPQGGFISNKRRPF